MGHWHPHRALVRIDGALGGTQLGFVGIRRGSICVGHFDHRFRVGSCLKHRIFRARTFGTSSEMDGDLIPPCGNCRLAAHFGPAPATPALIEIVRNRIRPIESDTRLGRRTSAQNESAPENDARGNAPGQADAGAAREVKSEGGLGLNQHAPRHNHEKHENNSVRVLRVFRCLRELSL